MHGLLGTPSLSYEHTRLLLRHATMPPCLSAHMAMLFGDRPWRCWGSSDPITRTAQHLCLVCPAPQASTFDFLDAICPSMSRLPCLDSRPCSHLSRTRDFNTHTRPAICAAHGQPLTAKRANLTFIGVWARSHCRIDSRDYYFSQRSRLSAYARPVVHPCLSSHMSRSTVVSDSQLSYIQEQVAFLVSSILAMLLFLYKEQASADTF